MRKVLTISAIFLAGFLLFSVGAPDPAQARCKTFNASHNGTDMFYDEGMRAQSKTSFSGMSSSGRARRTSNVYALAV
jgi:hypothetical protein